MTSISKLAPWCLAAALAVAAHAMHVVSDQARAALPPLQQFAMLPDGSTLRILSLGFKNVIADLLWLRAVQAIGERTVSEESGKWIYRAVDIVTTLDPNFVEAYEHGGIALCTVVVLPEESNRILEKGMNHNPQEWRLPFVLGINYYFELADDAKAAEYVAKAAAIGGGPEYLASFASRLYMNAKEPQKGIEFLSKSYEQTTDPEMKKFLAFRLKEALVERDLQTFESAIAQYRRQFGKPPGSLGDLVTSGLIPAVPLDPMGGLYLYDIVSQTVRSTSTEHRYQTHGHRRRS
jgi:hypothetical protein